VLTRASARRITQALSRALLIGLLVAVGVQWPVVMASAEPAGEPTEIPECADAVCIIDLVDGELVDPVANSDTGLTPAPQICYDQNADETYVEILCERDFGSWSNSRQCYMRLAAIQSPDENVPC
jgi:hypothetical protein